MTSMTIRVKVGVMDWWSVVAEIQCQRSGSDVTKIQSLLGFILTRIPTKLHQLLLLIFFPSLHGPTHRLTHTWTDTAKAIPASPAWLVYR